MFFRLAFLFVTVPLIELALLVWLGRRMGLLATVLLVIATGVLGATLARRQGLAALREFRAAVDLGQLPHRELVGGVLILFAGAVLLTPGLLTDIAGFLLLVPTVRRRVRDRVVEALARRWQTPVRWSPRDGSMEADYRVVEEATSDRPSRSEPPRLEAGEPPTARGRGR